MTGIQRVSPGPGREGGPFGLAGRLRARLVLAALVLLFLGAVVVLRGTLPKSTAGTRTAELAEAARSIQDLVRLRLDGNRDFLAMLARELADGGLDGSTFRDRASPWAAAHPELRNVTLVDASLVVRDVTPVQGNSQILGLRIELPEPARTSARAKDEGVPAYTLPFEAIQGRASFEVWVPIGQGGSSRGLLAGVYDCAALLEAVAPEHFRTAARISLTGPSGGTLASLPGPSDVDARIRFELPLSPPGGGVRLVLEGRPAPGLPAGVRLLLAVCGLLAAAITVLLVLLGRGAIRRRRAEAALESQEDRFQLLRSQARDVLLFLEPDGRIADANRAAEEAYGLRSAELLRKPFFELVPESHRAETRVLLERARNGDVTAETVNLRLDGATFPVEARIHPVGKGNSSVLLAVLRDISEKKASEARLLQLNRLLRTLTEVGQLVVREKDRTALLHEVCRILVEHGRFRAARIELTEPEDGEGSPPVRASAGDESGEDSGAGPEATFPFRVGERVAGFVGVRAAVPAGIGGEEANLLEGLAADLGHALQAIDEGVSRHHAEQDLRRELDLLLRIAETSPVAITRVDASGRIDFGNRRAEEILGLSQERMTGRYYEAPDWRITATDGSPFPASELPIPRVLATGQPVFDVRHSIVQPGGERRDLSVNAAPLVDEAGTVSGVVATMEDITERVRAETSLREEKERLRFALEALQAGLWDLDLVTHAVSGRFGTTRSSATTRSFRSGPTSASSSTSCPWTGTRWAGSSAAPWRPGARGTSSAGSHAPTAP
ncbi:MAG: PAS domain S-box protein [Thermoanaerobaculia bacterium]|nr:PAS domain S-box protein [Thermoanaerobaculia bacterium]